MNQNDINMKPLLPPEPSSDKFDFHTVRVYSFVERMWYCFTTNFFPGYKLKTTISYICNIFYIHIRK